MFLAQWAANRQPIFTCEVKIENDNVNIVA
jgi:hypothetical protein